MSCSLEYDFLRSCSSHIKLCIVDMQYLHIQENPEQPMDLSAFRCQHVSVSFAVVSKHDISSYSPSEQTCIHGFKGNQLL